MKTTLAEQSDLPKIAAIHAACFARQQRSGEWIACQFAAYPAKRLLKAEINGQIVGYAIWAEKSGFRERAVLELEQIGVLPEKQGQGIGSALITECLAVIKQKIIERGASVHAVLVTTRADNGAQLLYRRVLGAEIVATIPRLFGTADEVVMLAECCHAQPEINHKFRVLEKS